jgi:hypothetical protein
MIKALLVGAIVTVCGVSSVGAQSSLFDSSPMNGWTLPKQNQTRVRNKTIDDIQHAVGILEHAFKCPVPAQQVGDVTTFGWEEFKGTTSTFDLRSFSIQNVDPPGVRHSSRITVLYGRIERIRVAVTKVEIRCAGDRKCISVNSDDTTEIKGFVTVDACDEENAGYVELALAGR